MRARLFRHVICSLLVASMPVAPVSVGVAQERGLQLHEVLDSVERHHPRIRAVAERVRRAEGNVLAAEGGFDPTLSASGTATQGGYYNLRRLDVELSQPTALWGAEVYTGYRLGRGFYGDPSWPSYMPGETMDGGAVRAGLRVPLWRGGPIDERRARLEGNRYLEEAARQTQGLELLDLRLASAHAYWHWVAAGQAFLVSDALWQLARDRDTQLQSAFRAGAVPAIDVTDNERMVYEREERRVHARRALERASFDLALFLRDERGEPVAPTPERLPAELEPAVPVALPVEDLTYQVLMCHPAAQRIVAELRALGVEVRLAKNRVGPAVLGTLQVSRGLGEPEDARLAGTVMETGVMLSMPLPLRQERGALQATRAQQAEREADLRWLKQRLEVEVSDVASRVRAAHERLEKATRVVGKAEELADAERRRFQAGASNLLFVNVREQQLADARLRWVEATAETQLATVHWRNLSSATCKDAP